MHENLLNNLSVSPESETHLNTSMNANLKNQKEIKEDGVLNTEDLLGQLPFEITINFLRYLDERDLCRMSQVSSRWNILSSDDSLWKELYNNRWKLSTCKCTPFSCGETWKKKYVQQEFLSRDFWVGAKVHRQSFRYHNAIHCLQLNGNRLIGGSRDYKIRQWDPFTGVCFMEIDVHMAPVLSLQFDNEKIVTASADRTIKIFSTLTGICLQTLVSHTEAVTCIQFDDRYIVSGSRDSTLKVWDVERLLPLRTISASGPVTCLQFTRDLLFFGTEDRFLQIWSFSAQQITHSLPHPGIVWCLQVLTTSLPDSAADSTWNSSSTSNSSRSLNSAPSTPVTGGDIEAIVTGCGDHHVRVWRFEDATTVNGSGIRAKTREVVCKQTFRELSSVDCLLVSSNRIITGCRDGSVKFWSWDGVKSLSSSPPINSAATPSSSSASSSLSGNCCSSSSGDDVESSSSSMSTSSSSSSSSSSGSRRGNRAANIMNEFLFDGSISCLQCCDGKLVCGVSKYDYDDLDLPPKVSLEILTRYPFPFLSDSTHSNHNSSSSSQSSVSSSVSSSNSSGSSISSSNWGNSSSGYGSRMSCAGGYPQGPGNGFVSSSVHAINGHSHITKTIIAPSSPSPPIQGFFPLPTPPKKGVK